ncbi:MAG: tetratricopeptide repeat protein [Hyphomicrobiaceae bacterium]|nr:tetratricopeptide repeat protein [Hyphomicrobiaceae bacterium]
MHAKAARCTALTSTLAFGLAAAFTLAQHGALAETPEPQTVEADQLQTHSLVGSYLAGRLARSLNDSESAAVFYRDALARDPGNGVLLEQALLMELSAGKYERAIELSRTLVAIEPTHRIAHLLLGLEAFNEKSYKTAETHFRGAATNPLGQLTGAIAIGWIKVAEGDIGSATQLADVAKQADWAQNYVRYQRALMYDVGGKRQEARTAYQGVFKQDNKALRPTTAYVAHLAHSGDVKQARAIMKEYLDKVQGDPHPLATDLNTRLQSSGKVDLVIGSPAEGLAEVFYGLGEALASEGGVALGVAYLQMALFVKPDHELALVALAGAEEAQKRYEAAIATYDRIAKTSPLAPAVGIRKAFDLNSLDKVDEARSTLIALLDTKVEGGDKPATTPLPTPTPAAEVSNEAAAVAAAGEGEAPAAGSEQPQAAVSEPPSDEAPLRLGAKDDRVLKLQEALTKLGYDIGTADGAFGDKTRKAVMQFQREKKLRSDGLVGPETYGLILGVEPGAVATEVAVAAPPAAAAAATKPKISRNDALQLQVLDALGSIMRARKLYEEAAGYYDKAIALIPNPGKQHWAYFYARGTCYERLKNWPAAEKDLQKALSLVPDQPLVLNYLGYSWIDQGTNLKEGMSLIEQAVALKPDDGYIVDSLGWAHFKQGNFTDAVNYLERAVELKPDDPVLNDHLGDALWRVGRQREARFQWDQSLSLKPEPEDAEKTKKKIAEGLVALPPLVDEVKTKTSSTEPPRRRSENKAGPQPRRVQ